MALWSFSESGSGRPLVLLHGIGMSHAAWKAVTPHLSLTRRVIAFDTAGFGSTPPLPAGTLPTIQNLVESLGRSIEAVGITCPVDIAGNSLGGAMALHAATCGLARSVVAISPSGLWNDHGAVHVRYVFRSMRLISAHAPRLLKAALQIPLMRELALAIPVSIGSARMPADAAQRAVDDLAGSRAFEATFDNTSVPLAVRDIVVPVTVAFGSRDWILTRGSRCRNRLPPQARWIEKPGWGHVPMWADPVGVAQLILEGTERDSGAGP